MRIFELFVKKERTFEDFKANFLILKRPHVSKQKIANTERWNNELNVRLTMSSN